MNSEMDNVKKNFFSLAFFLNIFTMNDVTTGAYLIIYHTFVVVCQLFQNIL